MRDTSGLRSKAGYDTQIAYLDECLQDRRRTLSCGIESPAYAGECAFQGFVFALERLQCLYSRGDGLASMKACLRKVVDIQAWAYGVEERCFPPDVLHTRTSFRLNLNRYVYSLWMLSFAICLDLDDKAFARMLGVMGNAGVDAVFDRMAAQRDRDRPIAPKPAHPRVTGLLFETMKSPAPQRGPLLSEYLSTWYKRMKPTRWHDAHLRRDSDRYNGYWSFESAGFVKAFGVDDCLLIDLPYYPADLVRGRTARRAQQ